MKVHQGSPTHSSSSIGSLDHLHSFWLRLAKPAFFLRQEFVQFLIYAFGEELAFAWEELDDDGSNELSEDEWFQAVKRIGPAKNREKVNDGWLKRHLNPKKHR